MSAPLEPGVTYVGAARTITDAEIALLPALMGAVNALFHDEESARRGPLGRRVLYGPALLGIAIAGTELFLRDHVIGLLGITDLRFRTAVGAGDTVTPTLTVVERINRPDKAGDLLRLGDQVHNQHGALVLEFTRTVMVRHEERT
jgi:acyl dehydratase